MAFWGGALLGFLVACAWLLVVVPWRAGGGPRHSTSGHRLSVTVRDNKDVEGI